MLVKPPFDKLLEGNDNVLLIGDINPSETNLKDFCILMLTNRKDAFQICMTTESGLPVITNWLKKKSLKINYRSYKDTNEFGITNYI